MLGGQGVKAAGGLSYAPTFAGTLVHLELHGHEPDFDPIYRLVISARLHDRAAGDKALPDGMLVLSSYMESFTPSTTPILPDLLHPDQLAEGLRGFLQGKAALVNAGGTIAYRGSLLAEIFRDNAVHLVVTLQREGGSPLAEPLRLQGIFGLNRGAMHGSLRASGPLDRAALAVPAKAWPSWQTVVGQLVVHPPAMIGVAAAPPLAARSTALPRSKAPTTLPIVARGGSGAHAPIRSAVRAIHARAVARTGAVSHFLNGGTGQAGPSRSAAIAVRALAIVLVLGAVAVLLRWRSKRRAAASRPLPAATGGGAR